MEPQQAAPPIVDDRPSSEETQGVNQREIEARIAALTARYGNAFASPDAQAIARAAIAAAVDGSATLRTVALGATDEPFANFAAWRAADEDESR